MANGDKEHEVHAEDALTVTESAFVHRRGEDGSEGITLSRGGDDQRQSRADVSSSGGLTDEIHGAASHKSLSELRAAAVLVEHLNMNSAQWSAPEAWPDSEHEEGVDCVARGPQGELLKIQVTTPERSAWAQLAKVESIARQASAQEAVAALRQAIAHKRLKAHGDTVLVLDATDSPQYALQAVAQEFVREHGGWTRSIGFAEVWVAGPVRETVHRLDVQHAKEFGASGETDLD